MQIKEFKILKFKIRKYKTRIKLQSLDYVKDQTKKTPNYYKHLFKTIFTLIEFSLSSIFHDFELSSSKTNNNGSSALAVLSLLFYVLFRTNLKYINLISVSASYTKCVIKLLMKDQYNLHSNVQVLDKKTVGISKLESSFIILHILPFITFNRRTHA